MFHQFIFNDSVRNCYISTKWITLPVWPFDCKCKAMTSLSLIFYQDLLKNYKLPYFLATFFGVLLRSLLLSSCFFMHLYMVGSVCSLLLLSSFLVLMGEWRLGMEGSGKGSDSAATSYSVVNEWNCTAY